jgi:hypothetical protein
VELVPARIVACRRSVSTASIPWCSSSEISTPSVWHSGVNEWPVPATRTPWPARAAARTVSAISASLFGVAMLTGRKDTRPEKFVQAAALTLAGCRRSEA